MSSKVLLKGRSLLSLLDVSSEEIRYLLDLSHRLKADRVQQCIGRRLLRRHVALLFEKASTRTRCATTVAVGDEGGIAHYLPGSDIHLGSKETVPDTARVLGRMFDGIMFRGYSQDTVNALAEFSGIPVWNGLTDISHPTQALADLMTIEECFGALDDVRVAYVGDGRNNVANSLMLACAKMGMSFVNCTPESLTPDPELVGVAEQLAAEGGGRVRVARDPMSAVEGANVVYTDVWVSMGEEQQMKSRLSLLRPYQVNAELMRATGNAEGGRLVFLHCLPAFHNANTDVSRETGAQEVTDDVFEGTFSRVFDQAENRLHTIKALMVATIGREETGDGSAITD